MPQGGLTFHTRSEIQAHHCLQITHFVESRGNKRAIDAVKRYPKIVLLHLCHLTYYTILVKLCLYLASINICNLLFISINQIMISKMNLTKRLLLFVVTFLYRLVLLIGVPLICAVVLFAHPGKFKSALIDTEAYKLFVPSVVESLAKTQDANSIPFKDPQVKNIITTAVPPAVIQANSETIIDSFYTWFSGATPSPEFKVDFTPYKSVIAENISLYGLNRLAAQPLCETDPADINPFTSKCLPRSFKLADERKDFEKSIDSAFPNTVYTANSLPKFAGGKSITHDFPWAPTAYRVLVESPLAIGLAALLLAVAMVQLSRSARLGVRQLGNVTLSTGITLVITPILYIIAYPHIAKALHIQSSNTGLNAVIDRLSNSLSHSFYAALLIASLIIINIGVLIIFAEHSTRTKDYETIRKKTGVVSSGAPKRIPKTKGVQASTAPIQTSEGKRRIKAKTKLFKTFRKRQEKELS